MKKYLIGLAALAALAAPAQAGCSKANLSGNWVADVAGGLGIATSIAGGKFTTLFGGSAPVTVNIAKFGANCRGTGTMKIFFPSSPPVVFTIPAMVRSEITPASGKPNNLVVLGQFGPGSVAIQLNRLP
jgi:hypothetical protein